jgi:hypothetical protein
MANSDDLRIGDFSKPLAPRSPVKDSLDAAEKQIDEEATRDEATLKPMLSFEESLKEAGVTREKAAEIVDAVLLKGFYAEDVSITKTISARFRTRNARDTRRAQEMLETHRLSYDVHYQELMARYLLASSLESFGGDKLNHPPKNAKYEVIEKSYSERLAYVDALSDPALRVLFVKISKFDQKINAVLREGTVENF